MPRFAPLLLVAFGCESRGVATVTTTSIDPPAGMGAKAPNLRATSDGVVVATWFEPSGTGHRLRMSRWNRGWSAPMTIADGPRLVASWADVPVLADDGAGDLVIAWAESSPAGGNGYDSVVARSTDGGNTWNRLGLLNRDGTATEHGFVSLAAGRGSVRAFWLDGRDTASGGATALRTAEVTSEIRGDAIVDPRVCDCCATAAAMTDAGPRVVYRDRSEDEVRDIALGGADGGGHVVYTDGWKIAGCPVNGPALDTDGKRLVVAWYTLAGEVPRVRAAFSDDAGATFGDPIDVDSPEGGRAPLGRVSVVLDGDGRAIVGWLDGARDRAHLMLRAVQRDGKAGTAVEIANTSARRESGVPRIARSGHDLLVVWTSPGPPARLRAARVPLATLL